MSKYLNINIIQTLPVNNINRDDQGNVKTVSFGGAIRQRISSQCWKRAIKDYFNSININTDKSSSFYPQIIYDRAVERGAPSDKAIEAIAKVFTVKRKNKYVVTIKDWDAKATPVQNYSTLVQGTKKLKSVVQMFLSDNEVNMIVDAIVNDTLDSIGAIICDGTKRYGAVIALFGRMFADYDTMGVSAASSFAHAFTTHECSQESDYFTLVDDLKGTKGAEHLNQKSYSTGTFYRHIVLNITEFEKLLEGTGLNAKDMVKKFMEACVKAFPTGSKNGMYANSLYEKIIVDVTESAPITLANAFETPVCSNEGYEVKSIEALKAYRNKLSYRGYDVIDSFESSDTEEGSYKSLINFIDKVC